MAEIDRVSNLMLILIRTGVATRAIYCLLKTIYSDEAEVYKKRLFKVLKFYIFAECILSLQQLSYYYFS